MPEIGVPARSEAAEYYFTYIDQVPPGDILAVLAGQMTETVTLLRGIGEPQSQHRYAPGKWSVREVLGHLNDAERVFAFRAFWFARGLEHPLPSFDQDAGAAAAGADARSLASHIEEFQRIRAATLSFFETVPDEVWDRRGVASGNPFTVRALAYICAGHVTHHMTILRDRYLSPQAS
jgi:hypothetical protein